VDGIVGYQTWAALREDAPRPPSTDGRAPHTYVEHGAEARWLTDQTGILYGAGDDTLYIEAFNTGDVPIAPGQFTATANLTPVAGGNTVQLHLTAFTDDGQAAQPGGRLYFGVPNVSNDAGHGEFTVQAWMPPELGGDQINGQVTIT